MIAKDIFIALIIHLIIPLTGLLFFLRIKRQMKIENIINAPTPELFIIFSTYGGDFDSARKIHFKLYDVMKTIFADGSPGGIKVVLHEMGLCENVVRLPLSNVNATVENRLRQMASTIK